jgi:hypothetical protein
VKKESEKKKTLDEVRFGPSVGPNSRIAVRRNEDGEEPVIVHRAVDGAPLPPDVEILNVNGECRDGWHTVTSLGRTGPAQVATPAYREGYDRIFGKKTQVGLA